MSDGGMGLAEAAEKLAARRAAGVDLRPQSREFLSMADGQPQAAVLQKFKNTPLVQQSAITCMEVLRKDTDQVILILNKGLCFR